jgi:hypothetical protein
LRALGYRAALLKAQFDAEIAVSLLGISFAIRASEGVTTDEA